MPKNAGGAKIKTALVTAAITGTTIMLEYHANAFIKFIILEGTGRIMLNSKLGESVLLHAGQMRIVNPSGTTLPQPVDVDLDRLKKTSGLMSGKFSPLASQDLIGQEIRAQELLKAQMALLDTNLVIFGSGTAVNLVDAIDQKTEATRGSGGRVPTPTPTPFPTATPTASPTPSPTPKPTASPTPTPTATASPSATPSPTGAPSPTSTPTPTATPARTRVL